MRDIYLLGSNFHVTWFWLTCMVKPKSIVPSIHIFCTHENPLLKFFQTPGPLVSNYQHVAYPPSPLCQQWSAFAIPPTPPLPADVICKQPHIKWVWMFLCWHSSTLCSAQSLCVLRWLSKETTMLIGMTSQQRLQKGFGNLLQRKSSQMWPWCLMMAHDYQVTRSSSPLAALSSRRSWWRRLPRIPWSSWEGLRPACWSPS